MWQIEFTEKADKEFAKLSPETKKRIDKALYGKLLKNPNIHLEPLVADFHGFYKFRVGNYRIICVKENRKLIITVVKIAHRKEVYTLH